MTPSHPFPARFDGVCAAKCEYRIHSGDMVQYVDDKLVHHGCLPVDEPAEPAPRPTCGECFIEKAVNGACGCDGMP